MDEKAITRRAAVKIEKSTYRKVRRIAKVNRMTITDAIECAVAAFEQLPETEQLRLIRRNPEPAPA